MEKIKIEDIEAKVERKKIRNIYISVNSSTGEVSVSAPLKAAEHTVKAFFASKISWIRKHREKIAKRPPKIHNMYLEGEKVEVFGKKYELRIFEYAAKPKVFLNFDSIDMYIKRGAALSERKEAMHSFYKSKLEEVVPSFVLKWEEKIGIYTELNPLRFLFRNIQGKLFCSGNEQQAAPLVLRNPVKLSYRHMKGKWGSCGISDKKITLNTELAKKSLRCVEYVTAHEILHLRERKHNKKFRDYMKQAFPDWKKLEAELEGYI